MMRVGVDVGGTFTDLVAVSTDGTIELRKVASTPQDPSLGLFRALEALGPQPIHVLVHGTTVATNALLERRGARVALLTTAGFEDLLWLRRQDRPALYDLARDHPPPLVARGDVIGVRERMGPQGAVLPLSRSEVTRVIAAVRALAPPPEAVAISLLFAFRHPAHERSLAAALRAALGDVPVAASHEVLPVFREYERTSTTAAEAYLRPVVGEYLAKNATLSERIDSLRIMTSSGGTLGPEQAARHAASLALSGPAGGVVGARLVGEAVDARDLLTLDMGGTSADASLVTGGVALTEGANAVGGVRLALPAILIETVSAGGGSIAAVDEGGALRVGPRSAGAEPGPACYGRGGQSPTVTDADVVLGRVDPERFAAGRIPLDAGKAAAAVGAEIGRRYGMGDRAAAYGIAEIVDENMANAARVHAVERGKVVADYTLIAFGGAAPLHVARLAEKLGIARIIVPPDAGVGSAIGFLRAPVAFEVVRSRYTRLAALDVAAVNGLLAEMRAEAHEVVAPGAAGAVLAERRSAFMRYVGQGHEIVVKLPAGALTLADLQGLRAEFERDYAALFTRIIPNAEIEILTFTLSLGTIAEPLSPGAPMPANWSAAPAGARRIYDAGSDRDIEVPVYRRPELAPGARLAGPAIIAEDETSTFVSASFDASVNAQGCIVLDRKN